MSQLGGESYHSSEERFVLQCVWQLQELSYEIRLHVSHEDMCQFTIDGASALRGCMRMARAQVAMKYL